ncbi:MAG TPA: hypothetical protein VF613_21625 [Longimicrobium sp.]
MIPNGQISRGLDYLTTIRSDQYIELAPEQLGEGMERFSETVTLIGIPLSPPVGNADTIMERVDDGEIGRAIPTRLVAFANMSAAPIKLEGKGRLTGYYDLYVTLSPTKESPGRTIYYSDDGSSGTFESIATFWPLFELRPLGGGESIFVDTGTTPVPGFPMSIGSAGGTWSLEPPTQNSVRGFRAKPFFYTGEVIITAKRAGQDSAIIPMLGGGDTIAKCAKIQAEFTSDLNPGRLQRVGLGATKPLANLELS